MIAFIRRHILVIEWIGGVIPSIIAAIWMALNIPSSEQSYWLFTPCSLILVLIFLLEGRKSFLCLNIVYFCINILGLYTRHWL